MIQRVLAILFFGLFILGATMGEDSSPLATEEQKGFGLQQQIFKHTRKPSTNFAQNFSGMADYLLTPGDVFTLTINLGINSKIKEAGFLSYPLQLQENYDLDVPMIGTINTKGKTIPDLQKEISKRIKAVMPVEYVNFVLTSPAQFNVFVYGGVALPGFIVMTPLNRVIDAIAACGGLMPGATYRQIQLIRGNKQLALDISRFYSQADISANPVLQPGDKIYIPQAQIITQIKGKVFYPGSYELLPGETLQDLINLAGGFQPDALKTDFDVSRLDQQGQISLAKVTASEVKDFKLQMGDTVKIRSTVEISEMVVVEGAVFGKRSAGDQPLQVPNVPIRIDLPFLPGMTVLSLLDAVGGPTPFAILDRAYLKKKTEGQRVSLNLKEIWTNRDMDKDLALQPGDAVVIPMKMLKVFVSGAVNSPGSFPYVQGTRVRDYLLLAGGIDTVKGDPQGIFLIDEIGRKTKLNTTDEVDVDSIIYVEENPVYKTNSFFQNVFVFTAIAVTAITFINTTWDLVDRIAAIQ